MPLILFAIKSPPITIYSFVPPIGLKMKIFKINSESEDGNLFVKFQVPEKSGSLSFEEQKVLLTNRKTIEDATLSGSGYIDKEGISHISLTVAYKKGKRTVTFSGKIKKDGTGEGLAKSSFEGSYSVTFEAQQSQKLEDFVQKQN